MSYCVNCGVELDPAADACPLCGAPAWRPQGQVRTDPYFPSRRAVIDPVSKRALGLIVSSMLLSASLCCGILNLLLPSGRPWSLYVIGAAVMLWIWFVLPLLLRLPTFLKLTLDVAAVGIYVQLIAVTLHGGVWFRGLVLPMLCVVCAVVFLLSFLLRGNRRSKLSAISLSIGAVGLLALGIEFCIDRYCSGIWSPGWSLTTVAICVALIVPLRIIRHVPALREEVRRRFNL